LLCLQHPKTLPKGSVGQLTNCEKNCSIIGSCAPQTPMITLMSSPAEYQQLLYFVSYKKQL